MASFNNLTPTEDILETPELVSAAQKSLALGLLSHNLRVDQRYTILDLGPAVAENIDFWSNYSCKIYIEDFYQTLISENAWPQGNTPKTQGVDIDAPTSGQTQTKKLVDWLMPYAPKTRFDVIFVWDLFNYLAREPLHELISHLSGYCRPGTLIFALVSTRVQISQQPLVYKILGHDQLLYESTSNLECVNPRYREINLLRAMPNFRTHKSFLLRNGIQEYIFIYEG